MHEKWSTAIVKEVMEAAGGDAWQRYKAEAEAAGREVIPGEAEAGEKRVLSRKTNLKGALPGLDEFRAARAKVSKEVPPIPLETISQAEAASSL